MTFTKKRRLLLWLMISVFMEVNLIACAPGKPKYLTREYKSDVSLVIKDFVFSKNAEPQPGLEQKLSDRIVLEIDARYPAGFQAIYRNNHPSLNKFILVEGEIVEFGKSSSAINEWLNQYGVNKFKAKVIITNGKTGKSLSEALEIDQNIYTMDETFGGFSLSFTLEDAITSVAKKTALHLLKIDQNKLTKLLGEMNVSLYHQR